MSSTVLIIGGIALVGVAYYSYKRRQAKKNVSKEELINSLVSNMDAERIDSLELSDVVNYFKGLQLKKGVDVPFIATTTKDGVKSYLLASYNEETDKISNGKLITPDTIKDDLMKVIGNDSFVVLS